MPQLSVNGPFDERTLYDNLRPNPMRADTRQADCFGEGAFGDFDLVEPRTQPDQLLRVEACANLAREDELLTFEVAEQQRAESTAFALRISEAADYQLLRRLAFHLEPIRRPAVFIGRIATLGDHAFPPFATSPVPWLLAGNLRDGVERRPQPEIAQHGAALHERQRHQVASIQPEDVEHVISNVRTAPIDLTIQDDLIQKQ